MNGIITNLQPGFTHRRPLWSSGFWSVFWSPWRQCIRTRCWAASPSTWRFQKRSTTHIRAPKIYQVVINHHLSISTDKFRPINHPDIERCTTFGNVQYLSATWTRYRTSASGRRWRSIVWTSIGRIAVMQSHSPNLWRSSQHYFGANVGCERSYLVLGWCDVFASSSRTLFTSNFPHTILVMVKISGRRYQVKKE